MDSIETKLLDYIKLKNTDRILLNEFFTFNQHIDKNQILLSLFYLHINNGIQISFFCPMCEAELNSCNLCQNEIDKGIYECDNCGHSFWFLNPKHTFIIHKKDDFANNSISLLSQSIER